MERMRDTLIPALANKIDRKLRKDLKETSAVAPMIDLWGSPSMDSEIGVSVSYVRPDFTPRTALLDCVQMEGRHTASNIHAEYDAVVTRYGIKEKVNYIFIIVSPFIPFKKCISCFR